MPVQTQTRSQPPPDPFSDPNPIRLVTSKVSPKRDTAMDNSRESPAQDQYRTKPIRSQTQQTVGGRPQAPPRRSLSQDSAPAPPVPEKANTPKRPKKSAHADVIDRLDFSGVGPTFHHDGPFDACAPSRNKHRTKAPMAAWSEQTKQKIEQEFQASKPLYEPPRQTADPMAMVFGHVPEPFEDFSAGGGQISEFRPSYTRSRRSEEAVPARRNRLPPPQPIFVPGPEADFVPPESSPPLSPGPAGMKRSKSLMQRIRRMRENSNIPVANGDSNDPQNTYESGGRPNHKSQNSFAGRLVGGGIKEQLPSPPEEETTNSAGHFEGQADAETGLGRRRSLMRRVGGAVKGRK